MTRVVGLASQNDKATMMWAIQRVPERKRALSLGCRGLMTSNIVGVPPHSALTRLRTAGCTRTRRGAPA